jgi:hypothetical protein
VRVWIRQLRISRPVAEKIVRCHGITPAQVRASVVQVEGLEGAWDYDPGRGLRALVGVDIEDEPALVVVYPADDLGVDIWRLGSAYFVRG